MFELNNIGSIAISIASPEKIREWSHGEVTKPETVNYRTQKPEPDGLFCEKIFGPTQDWRCRCGKYKLIRYKGVICDKCGVEVTQKKVRRERMGHIELATPVSHIWYFRGVPSRIGTILELTPKYLEQILYYVSYVVLDPGNTPLEYKQILTDKDYRDACEMYGANNFRVGMGAEAVKELLASIDLEKEREELKASVAKDKGQKKIKSAKKLEVVEAFIKSGNRPEWMILDVIPVLPPELRPMVQLDGGRYATSDLNDLYRRVINRNNRLKKLMEIGAPDVIIRNEKRMLQEAVDALIDNGKRGKPVQNSKQKDLKSLTAILKGKQGRFRQNMLGKRVDFSGRSVIVVGPSLKMYQCGLPKEMALELFKPFIMHELVKMNASHNIKSAKRMIDKARPVVWDVLDKVIKDHPVLLNRAPTLHKLGIQAFEPILVDGRAIKLHPLVCEGFHADFDGDQMPIHIPLSLEARAEARTIMISTNNILKPSDGRSIINPQKDMVIGVYYLTLYRPGAKGEGNAYSSEDEALMAYQTQNLDLQAKIFVRRSAKFNDETVTGLVETSVGKILFNRCVIQDIGYIDRSKRENVLRYEIEMPVTKKVIGQIVENTYNKQGPTKTVIMIDKIKDLGFEYSTLGSLTISLYDYRKSIVKEETVAEAENKVREIDKQFRRGLITLNEKKDKNIEIWKEATDKIEKNMIPSMEDFNPIRMMVDSGARGNAESLNQVAGIRGIVANTSGQKVDVPVKSNYKQGFSPIEYFMGSRGGRKVLADTALKTSESGYLTRRLVDVAQDVVVVDDDCFATRGESVKGLLVKEISKNGTVIQDLKTRIVGRFTVKAVVNPNTNEEIVPANTMISEKQANEIIAAGIKEVEIRTVFTCKCEHGVCAKCYGKNMGNNNIVSVGEAVGIIAAQSIGEPGTQLSMKNFSAGIVGGSDITQGLPRIVEIFEARQPKGMAYLSEIGGKVSIRDVDRRAEITVLASDGESAIYLLPFGSKVTVKDGETIEAGTPLSEGPISPRDLLRTKGLKALEEYLLQEVVAVYNGQGISINSKHIEIIIKQMLKKVKVESSGDTSLIPGEFVDIYAYEKENDAIIASGGVPALAKREVLGITKASLKSDSFLSAASFQEQASVLTDAAVKGKVDHLIGLKENVILGKLIPAGTGFSRYQSIVPKVIEDEKTAIVEKTENEDDIIQDFDMGDLTTID